MITPSRRNLLVQSSWFLETDEYKVTASDKLLFILLPKTQCKLGSPTNANNTPKSKNLGDYRLMEMI